MPFKKKNIQGNSATPEEVANLGQKHEVQAAKDKKTDAYDHFHAQEEAKKVADAKKRKKIYAIILGSLLGILIVLYLVSMLTTKWGDLTITIGDLRDGKTIMLCENADFEDGVSVKLNGGSVNEVTNITKSWLPEGLDNELGEGKGGQHNGEDYLAYTFYLKNTGDEDLEYNTTFNLTGATKSADEAARFQIYRNGEAQVYAKGKYDNREQAEADATAFVNDTTIFQTVNTPLKAGDSDKYTVVIWIEGEDPECKDPIRGGAVWSHMVFDIAAESSD